MVYMLQAYDYIDASGFRDSAMYYDRSGMISVTITAVPVHLAFAAVYLLVGKNGDDPTRMLFLPQKGPPEIKYLRVTLNQILNMLATRSAKHPRLLPITEEMLAT